MIRFHAPGLADVPAIKVTCHISIAVVSLALAQFAIAQEIADRTNRVGTASSDSTSSSMRQKATGLIKEDIERAISSDGLMNSKAGTEAETNAAAITMAPFIVTEEKPVTLPPTEKPIEQFFRTGSLVERKGPKVTTRLWMKGDKGLMLSFDF